MRVIQENNHSCIFRLMAVTATVADPVSGPVWDQLHGIFINHSWNTLIILQITFEPTLECFCICPHFCHCLHHTVVVSAAELCLMCKICFWSSLYSIEYYGIRMDTGSNTSHLQYWVLFYFFLNTVFTLQFWTGNSIEGIYFMFLRN